MLDPSSADSIAAASVATDTDPRMQINEAMHMPYQVRNLYHNFESQQLMPNYI